VGILKIELIDILLPLVATVAIAWLSLQTLDFKQQQTKKQHRDGLRVPWHRQRMLRLSRAELRVDTLARCTVFFVIIMSIRVIRHFSADLIVQLIVAAIMALILMMVVPPVVLALYRRMNGQTTGKQTRQSGGSIDDDPSDDDPAHRL
jgi:hypothetical protein